MILSFFETMVPCVNEQNRESLYYKNYSIFYVHKKGNEVDKYLYFSKKKDFQIN
jgi:hypothetical protein